jgi:type I restriction-modification system DNA methylase subunit
MAENNELERTLWAAADKMRSNMDAAEYKHVVLGLIFLKYISDAFNDLYFKLKEGKGEFEGADPPPHHNDNLPCGFQAQSLPHFFGNRHLTF